MNHSELFFGFPSGIQLIQGKYSFTQQVTIDSVTGEALRISGLMGRANHWRFFVNTVGELLFQNKNGSQLFIIGQTGTVTTVGGITVTGGNAVNFASSTLVVGIDGASNIFIGNTTGSGTVGNAIGLFGGAASVSARVVLGGSTTNAGTSVNGCYTNTLISGSSFVESASGTHALLASLVIKPLTIVAGVADTTNTATVYIEAAATGTITGKHYALWVDAGQVRVDDNIAAPSTSAGVAITNYYGSAATNFLGDPNIWLRINIGGTDYKIPCYG